jgi:hypothetical protein
VATPWHQIKRHTCLMPNAKRSRCKDCLLLDALILLGIKACIEEPHMIATRSRQNPSLPRSQILIISTPKHQSLICCGRYSALSQLRACYLIRSVCYLIRSVCCQVALPIQCSLACARAHRSWGICGCSNDRQK